MNIKIVKLSETIESQEKDIISINELRSKISEIVNNYLPETISFYSGIKVIVNGNAIGQDEYNKVKFPVKTLEVQSYKLEIRYEQENSYYRTIIGNAVSEWIKHETS